MIEIGDATEIQRMLECCALSDQGCVRGNNEDYCLARPDLGLYVLADGMGGAKAGEHASHLAVNTVVKVVEQSGAHDSQVLLQAVEDANRAVRNAAASDPQLDGMGTTLVVAMESGEDVLIASVGDSRVYLFDDSGFRAVTEDQTWIHDVGRPLGLDEETLRTHPMRHVLTMAIGVTSPLAINYYKVHLQPLALLLMCSDGLHGVVDHATIEAILRDSIVSNDGRLEEKCRLLIEAARQAGGPDNITAILLRCSA